MSHNLRKKQRGFTLIELMLAMTFVSFLLMAVALMTVQLGKTYNRGLTLKAVNQSGRDIADSLRRDINASRHSDVVFVQQSAAGAGDLNRLCLGQITYVWNYGAAIENGSARTFSDTRTPISLARLNDAGGTYCIKQNGAYPSTIARSRGTDLLEGGRVDLALHAFRFSPVVVDAGSGGAAFSVVFTLGTNDQSVIETAGQRCQPPEGGGNENFEFCAINVFEAVVRAGGAK